MKSTRSCRHCREDHGFRIAASILLPWHDLMKEPVRLPALLCLIALLAGAFAQPDSARAQSPRPVHIVVPFLGGGMADAVARIVVSRANELSRTPYQVENRPGDDGHFGAEVVAKAEPDGSTLLFAPIAVYASAVGLYAKLHYDFESDFAPVTLIANAPHVLVAHPSLPVKSIKDLLALAKARPGQMRWIAHGRNSLSQLEMEMLSSLSGIRINRVPFSNGGTMLAELVAGNAELGFDTVATTLPHVKSGKLRALALAGSQRSPALRELPTIAESGVPGFEADYWYAVLAPEGVVRPVIERLHDDLSKAVNSAGVRDRLLPHGIEVKSSTPAELARILREEVTKWAKVVKAARATRP